MAVGITFVVISGHLDLSVGSLLSLCVVVGVGLHDIYGPGIALPSMLAVGVIVGCLNGLLVGLIGLNSLVTTLGMLSILQGVTFVVANGKSPIVARPDDTWFALFARSYVGAVPTPTLILLAIGIVASIVLSRTTFGRSVYATGGNDVASRYATLEPRWIIFTTYVISGLATAAASVVLASRVMAGQNDTGAGYEIAVLSGVILGGASLMGGKGSILGSIAGMAVLGLIANALLFFGLPYTVQWIVTWFVIVFAVWLEMLGSKRRMMA
jgi:ribose/xylose/arabinose/galactoside ABC-type transport system permease subunit